MHVVRADIPLFIGMDVLCSETLVLILARRPYGNKYKVCQCLCREKSAHICHMEKEAYNIYAHRNSTTAPVLISPVCGKNIFANEKGETPWREISAVPYLIVLGYSIYLYTRSRPDIATTASHPGKFQADPTPNDWKALKHLRCYVKGTVAFGILLPMNCECTVLRAYSVAYWARDKSTLRSWSGVLIFLFRCSHSLAVQSAASNCDIYCGSWIFRARYVRTWSSMAPIISLWTSTTEIIVDYSSTGQLGHYHMYPRCARAAVPESHRASQLLR